MFNPESIILHFVQHMPIGIASRVERYREDNIVEIKKSEIRLTFGEYRCA